MKGSSKIKVQDSKSQWLRDAKWGFFTHYLPHVASGPDSVIPKKEWIKKVNSFDVKHLGDQLSALKVPYFFITVGQHCHYFCSPNKAFDKHFGADTGVRTERDLIADIAAELVPRGIKMCVYTISYGIFTYHHYYTAGENIPEWLEVLTEWSERWGKSISAWWADASGKVSFSQYQAYVNAYKAGNKDALVATKLWRGFPADKILEDYTGGESGFLLTVKDIRHHENRPVVFKKIPLHFLTFLGEFWGIMLAEKVDSFWL